MSRLPLKSDGQLEGHVTVALESALGGANHVASAAIPQQGWLLDGGLYVPDPCLTGGRIGCHIASQIRVVRRALGMAQAALSVTFVTRTPGTLELLTKWLAGDKEMPGWYTVPQHKGGRRRSGLERARVRLQTFPGKVAVVPVQVGHHDVALDQAAGLARIALSVLRGSCATDLARKQADVAVGI